MRYKTELTDALAYCLDALKRKEMSLQECLDLYPQHKDELSTLLGKFRIVHSLPIETARSEFSKKGHQALLNAIITRQPETLHDRLRAVWRNLAQRRDRKFSPVQVIAAAALAFFLVTGGVAYASDGAAPGDMLYGLDRAIERVRLHMAADVEDAVALRLKFAEERLKEVEDRIAADDIDHTQAALEYYGEEIAALAELVGGQDGFDEQAHTELVNAALNVHLEVLNKVLEKAPEQAQEAIQKVIDKNEKIPGFLKDKGKPEETGKPEKTGKPETTGQPEDPGSQAPLEIPGPGELP